MLQTPLRSMPEYDPLDDHLEDLEEPGTNLLQDFITPVRSAALDSTPLSISNGYTSEESDYSVATPSDEQMYSDMSFLQTADTNELVEVVADYVEDNDLTVLSPQQQRKFADKSALLATGKMIKGKTSKYRGVTQTSKTSWGAKYSAKRITNTCKTPDEAARAYDLYLKTHYPDKYTKFANFCVRCDRFVNPLGLPEFRNECCCDAASDSGSTEVESPPQHSETDADDDMDAARQHMLARGMGMGSDGIELREGSNLSISSLKLSFLEDDTEPLFDDMVLPPPPSDQNNEVVGDKKPIKRDSLTMAAVESFTNDGNLDQIIKDIDRSSLPTHPTDPSFSQHSSADTTNGFAPTSTATTVTDFSPEEWQNLSEYLMVDPDVAGTNAIHPAINMGPNNQSNLSNQPAMPSHTQHDQQRFGFKKIHSLDFEPIDSIDNLVDIKQEYPSAMDVDDLASAFMPPPSSIRTHVPVATPTPALPRQTTSSPSFPARVDIQTPFLEKYWRNDRKNIQCFPYCPEHGDYYRVRIENLQHRCKGVCRAAVKAYVTILTTQLLSPSGLLLLARCNSTFSRNEALSAQQYLNGTEIKNLQTLSAVGNVEKFNVLPNGSGVHFEVTFYPDVWKFEFDLPKKRRHGGPGEPDVDPSSSEFLYFFEIDVLYTGDKTTYQRLGQAESMSFQIGNTRTLLRQRNRMTEEPSDADRILGMDAMPDKKKVKVYLGQFARDSTITSDDDDEYDDAAAANVKSENAVPSAKYLDVDALGRIDSKDSSFDLEDGDYVFGKKTTQWYDHNEEHTGDSTDYKPYASPKGFKAVPADPDAATVAAMVKSGAKTVATSSAQEGTSAATKLPVEHSWPKLFTYSLACIPLSIVFLLVALIALIVFVVMPPLAKPVVRLLDALSDLELRQANSSFVQTDTRYVLNRLDTGTGKGMMRFHSSGAVWSRFGYFCGTKCVVALVMVVPVVLLSLVGLVLFPIRAASQGVLRSAKAAVLVSREYTRKAVGKPYGSDSTSNAHGDALV